jgi:hypothetical protein
MANADQVMKRFEEMLEAEGMTGQVSCVIDDEAKEMRLFSLTPKGEAFLRQNKRADWLGRASPPVSSHPVGASLSVGAWSRP